MGENHETAQPPNRGLKYKWTQEKQNGTSPVNRIRDRRVFTRGGRERFKSGEIPGKRAHEKHFTPAEN